MVLSEIPSMVGVWIFSGTRTFLVANLATNFQDLVAKVENLVALAPVLGAISRPAIFPTMVKFLVVALTV